MTEALCVLAHVLLLGLVAAGIAALLRALPWPASWVRAKPLGCPVCMGGHGAWLAMLLAWATSDLTLGTGELALYYFGATAVAAWLLHQLFPAPVVFPE